MLRNPADLRRAGDGARTRDIKLGRLALYQLSYSRVLPPRVTAHVARGAWWGKDSNLRRLAPSDLQSDPVGHLGTPPDRLARRRCASDVRPGRADGENRTRNRPITNRVLCQLSYVSRRPFLRETRRIVGRGEAVKRTRDANLRRSRELPPRLRTGVFERHAPAGQLRPNPVRFGGIPPRPRRASRPSGASSSATCAASPAATASSAAAASAAGPPSEGVAGA